METKIYSLILGGILMPTSNCSCIFIPSIKGDGNVDARTIDITNHDKIEFYANSATLNYSQQQEATATLSVTVDQNIFDLFEFKTES